MMKKAPLVYVEWEDSSSLGSVWNTSERLKDDTNLVCTSLGYLVHEDDGCVVVAGHRGEHQYAGDIRIPKRAILRRRRVKLPGK